LIQGQKWEKIIKIQINKPNWLQCTDRMEILLLLLLLWLHGPFILALAFLMENYKLPKYFVDYKPTGRRNIGRSGERWKDI
jgi:hypothetical protein